MKKNNKIIIMMASIILIMATAIAGTLAWLYTNTDPVVNTFIPAEVPNKVVEKTDDAVKNDVAIKNAGNINAYVRAEVVITWIEQDTNGNLTNNVYAHKPVEGIDYSITWLKDGWVEGDDGYFYYTKVVPAIDDPVTTNDDRVTGVLFTNCKPLIDQTTGKTPNQPVSDTEGYKYVLSVEIMGQTVQADGLTIVDGVEKKVVEAFWGVDPENMP